MGARAYVQTVGVAKSYGGVRALDGVDLRLGDGRIDAIIGPNGAGKTTLFNVLTGFAAPDTGSITFDGRALGERLRGLAADEKQFFTQLDAAQRAWAC